MGNVSWHLSVSHTFAIHSSIVCCIIWAPVICVSLVLIRVKMQRTPHNLRMMNNSFVYLKCTRASACMLASDRSCLPNAKWQPSFESYRWRIVYHHASPYLTGAPFYGHDVPRTGTMKRAIILFALGICDQFQLHCKFCAIASLFMPVSLHARVTQRCNHNLVFHNLHTARAR